MTTDSSPVHLRMMPPGLRQYPNSTLLLILEVISVTRVANSDSPKPEKNRLIHEGTFKEDLFSKDFKIGSTLLS